MFSFLANIKWYRIHIDFTKLLGRTYYFWQAGIWWTIDAIVFIAIGVDWKLLIVAIPLGIITAINTISWLRTLFYATMYKHTINNIDNLLDRASTFEGVPRSGKTSTINNFGYIISKMQWIKLQREYWKCMFVAYENLPEDIKDNYEEIIESYRFYIKHIDTHIPCLHSITTIYDGQGRRSYELEKGHLMQQERLPFRSVWVCDEISYLLPNSLVKSKDGVVEDIKNQFRWIGQFTESYALCSDIRMGDAFLGVRSVCGANFTLTKKQKWVLKPKFLCAILATYYAFIDLNLWLYSILKHGSKPYYKVEYSLMKSSRKTGKFISWLEKLKNNVGYRKYFYLKNGNKEGNASENQVISKTGTYYLKSCLDIKYNDRFYRNLYKAKGKSFKDPSTNTNWYPSKEELEKISS